MKKYKVRLGLPVQGVGTISGPRVSSPEGLFFGPPASAALVIPGVAEQRRRSQELACTVC